MFVAVGAKIMSSFLQAANKSFELRFAIKIPGKKERRFYFFCLQCFQYMIPAIGKLVTRKYNRKLFFRLITTDNSAMTNGQRFFFKADDSASLAASR